MKINFTTKGKADLNQIYVRLKDTANNIDATSKTGLSILKENFNKGVIKLISIPRNADAIEKSKLLAENKALTDIKQKITDYETLILNAYNDRKDYEKINARWLHNIMHPINELRNKTPNELSLYFDYYLNAKKDDLKHSTVKKLQAIGKRLERFERDTKTTTYIQEVNNDFKQRYKDWSDKKAYHKNTYIKTLKVLVTVCNHAHEINDKELHKHTSIITKGKPMKYAETDSVFLDFKELKKIENTIIVDKKIDVARDWLLVSCFTAQRISDFMRFNINDIVIMDKFKFLDIKQEKTDTPVLVYLDEIVLKIIKKYNGNFPPLFSQTSKAKNEIVYNLAVKEVGRLCGINNKVTAQIKNKATNRAETKTLEKHHFMSSHIGRRSYATNYYGKINTALLISATGHSSEMQFLRYVKAKPTANARELAKQMQALSKKNSTPMKVIKNASSQN